jgi:O-antigen ligase
MIELLPLGLGLAAVGAVAIAVTEVLVRRAEVGAALLLGAALISATLVGRVPSVTLSCGIRVLLIDVAFALVLAAGILRVLRMPRFTRWQRWALLVGIVLLLSLVRGAVAFGPQHAIAEFRLFLAFVAGALYFATFPPSNRLNDRIGRIWLALSIPIMILVCLRWLANFAGINLGVPPAEFGADAAIKVLNGPYTFFLADAVILTVPFWQLQDRRSRRLTWLGALLLLFVVLLNRRTAWLTIVVGLAVIMVRRRRLRRRVVAMVVGAVLLTIAGYVALGGSEGKEQIVATPAVGTGTLEWRIQGWSELLGGLSTDPVQWGIGEPLGSDFTREVQGSEVQAEPHNFYLTLLLRAGVVGLLALIALTGGLFRALWRIPPPGGQDGLLAPGVFPALLAMQIVWFLAWVPGMEQGIITGLAVGLAARSRGGVRFVQARRDTHDQRRLVALIGAGVAVMVLVALPFATDRGGDDPDIAVAGIVTPPLATPTSTSTTISPSIATSGRPSGATATRPLRTDTMAATSARPGSALSPSSSPTPPLTTATTTPATVPPSPTTVPPTMTTTSPTTTTAPTTTAPTTTTTAPTTTTTTTTAPTPP